MAAASFASSSPSDQCTGCLAVKTDYFGAATDVTCLTLPVIGPVGKAIVSDSHLLSVHALGGEPFVIVSDESTNAFSKKFTTHRETVIGPMWLDGRKSHRFVSGVDFVGGRSTNE